MTLVTLLTIIFFVFGLIIGSFLNVAICRYNTSKSFGGRSVCMSCNTTLSWYELIPLLSFLALGARCKSCKVKISLQYPLVESITGIIFAALFLKFQNFFFTSTLAFAGLYAYSAAMFSLLLVIAAYDLRHKIIPDTLAFVFGALAFLGLFLFSSQGVRIHVPALSSFLSGLVIAIPFALFWFLSRGRWMGLGDAKLAVGLGWFLGLSRVLSATILAFWTGALVGIFLILFGWKHGIKSEIPFAPFLVFGAAAVFLFELSLLPGF
ncbi:MAG TPA: prepilin peptidase [Candidatus Paceibacterota bacterium]